MGLLVTMRRQREMKEGHGRPGLHSLVGVRRSKHILIDIPLFSGLVHPY